MKAEIVKVVGQLVLMGGGLLATYLHARFARKKRAHEAARERSPLMETATGAMSLRPGYVVTDEPWGWSATSGPRLPYTVQAQVPRLDRRPLRPCVVVVVVGRADMSAKVARLLIGELQEHWRWDKGAWTAELRQDRFDAELSKPNEPAGAMAWARSRVDQVAELVELTLLGSALTPEQDALVDERRVEDEAELDGLAKTLEEDFAKQHPDVAMRIAEHIGSTRLWLALMRAQRLTNRALERLLTRWPNSDAESRALDEALTNPVRFGEAQLELVFAALGRRNDPRLPELLTRLISDPLLHERKLVLAWLEKRGDTTAIAPLRELETRCADEWREPVARSIQAIQFRTAEALNHTLGGLSVSEEGGSLALSAPLPVEDTGKD